MMKRIAYMLVLVMLAAGCTQPAQQKTTTTTQQIAPLTPTTAPAIPSDNLDSAFADLDRLGELENESG